MKKNAQDAIWAHGPRKIAEVLNCTDSAVYHWLSGKAKPRFDAAQRIVEILGKKAKVSIEDLLAPHEPTGAERIDHRRK